jgi:hypothetical protein
MLKCLRVVAVAIVFPYSVSTQAHSSGWTYISSSDAHDMYILPGSVENIGNHKKAWVRFNNRNTDATYTVNQLYFDCKNRSFLAKSKFEYKSNGDIINSENYPVIANLFVEPPPRSIGNAIIDLVCNHN